MSFVLFQLRHNSLRSGVHLQKVAETTDNLPMHQSHKKVWCSALGCITFNGVRTLAFVDGNINDASNYKGILENSNKLVSSYSTTLSTKQLFKDGNAPVHKHV